MTSHLASHAPAPAEGRVADGYEPLAQVFADQFERGEQIGASLAVFHRGRLVVDLWGGWRDRRRRQPWSRDTRIVVFSVSKGLASMGLHLLADRGLLEWDAPVTQYWPEFGQGGKEGISVRTLLNHRAGLPALDEPITLEDCVDPTRAPRLRDLIERQRPA